MNADAWRAALAELPFGTLDDLVGDAPFLVLAPHPDDETLGCGGLLAAAAERAQAAHVLILTDGSASHPNSAEYPPARLAALRRREAEAAAARLGLSATAVSFLGLQDAAAPREGPAFDDAVEAIIASVRKTGARTLFVTSGFDPHCDHEAAFAMAEAAVRRVRARLWAYPVWSLHLPAGVEVGSAPPSGYRFDVGPWRDRKAAAIRCHASQMTPLIGDDPDGFVFTPEQLAPFLAEVETFIEVTA